MRVLQRPKKALTFIVLTLLSLIMVFLPANESFAAYRTVMAKWYTWGGSSSDFKYYSGGLGIKIYCLNEEGLSQTMKLKRLINGSWSTRDTNTVKCSSGMSYSYFYYPYAVAGALYRIDMSDGDGSNDTYVQIDVNPN